jgi:apolipoprotein N-acyltransferase
MTLASLGAATGLWEPELSYAWPALLLTFIGLFLRRVSRNPNTLRGDAVLLDLCFGLVAVTALVLWLQVFLVTVF